VVLSSHAERGPPGPLMSMMRTWRSALQDAPLEWRAPSKDDERAWRPAVRRESLVGPERHLVVAREIVELGQHGARFGFDDGLVYVGAGKGLDRLA
jgi:hypothetical protein